MKEYQRILKLIERLVKDMDLPGYRKTVKHNDDARWLKNNLHVRNAEHKNYKEVMDLLELVV